MSRFRHAIEANPIPWFFGALIGAFVAGIGTYQAVLAWSGHKVVRDEATMKLTVRVEPNPRDATVELGQEAGKFFQGMPLVDGASEFTVTKEGYRPQKVRLARGGSALVLSVQLPRFPRLAAGTQQKYIGEKLSLNFQNIDVRALIQVIADFTNKNVVVGEQVKGNVTLRLKDMPWDQALDLIALQMGLSMEVRGNVIYLDTL